MLLQLLLIIQKGFVLEKTSQIMNPQMTKQYAITILMIQYQQWEELTKVGKITLLYASLKRNSAELTPSDVSVGLPAGLNTALRFKLGFLNCRLPSMNRSIMKELVSSVTDSKICSTAV